MFVVVRDRQSVGTKTIDGKEYRLYAMTLVGNAEINDAVAHATDEEGNLLFQNDGQIFDGSAIAHGSIYLDVTHITGSLYDEENNSWATKES